MNRRASLRRLLGHPAIAPSDQKTIESNQTTLVSPKPPGPGLVPYTGPWNFEQAAHLFRRTTFGPNLELIRSAVDMGREAVLNQLFTITPPQDPPINPNFTEDPFVPVGETWIEAPYLEGLELAPYRHRSLRSWTILNMMQEGISIREKMTLFWINHFGIADTNDPRVTYRYVMTLQNSTLGNFRQLIKDITIDGSMLQFLNGNQNTKVAPNENYARELLELYTVGKGALAGEGDYSTFTEQDVAAMARVLTGWVTRGNFNVDPENPFRVEFIPQRHDTGVKQLSHRFDNTIISDKGAGEYAHLVDVIFQQPRVATFICRKLYQWFVYYDINEQTEAEVIAPLAQMLIDNDYELEPVVRTLLSSEHFFDILSVGPMIKNPLDYCLSIVKQLDMALPDDPATQYDVARRLYGLSSAMEMNYHQVPQVSGWKAYFQRPQFYRFWINASTLQLRSGLANLVSAGPIMINDFPFVYDPLAFVAKLEQPMDPNAVVEEFSRLLHPQPLTDLQKTALKDVLIPGLPDFEWTLEYGEYLADPDNQVLANAITIKLRQLTRALISLAEFHLS